MFIMPSIADLLPKGDIETNIRKHIHEVVYHHETTIPDYKLLPYQDKAYNKEKWCAIPRQ